MPVTHLNPMTISDPPHQHTSADRSGRARPPDHARNARKLSNRDEINAKHTGQGRLKDDAAATRSGVLVTTFVVSG
jgi:hypothetical protein